MFLCLFCTLANEFSTSSTVKPEIRMAKQKPITLRKWHLTTYGQTSFYLSIYRHLSIDRTRIKVGLSSLYFSSLYSFYFALVKFTTYPEFTAVGVTFCYWCQGSYITAHMISINEIMLKNAHKC